MDIYLGQAVAYFDSRPCTRSEPTLQEGNERGVSKDENAHAASVAKLVLHEFIVYICIV